jgi:hypothetical protein
MWIYICGFIYVIVWNVNICCYLLEYIYIFTSLGWNSGSMNRMFLSYMYLITSLMSRFCTDTFTSILAHSAALAAS